MHGIFVHGILVHGIVMHGILVHGSWGATWGEHGYVRLRRNVVNARLRPTNPPCASTHPWRPHDLFVAAGNDACLWMFVVGIGCFGVSPLFHCGLLSLNNSPPSQKARCLGSRMAAIAVDRRMRACAALPSMHHTRSCSLSPQADVGTRHHELQPSLSEPSADWTAGWGVPQRGVGTAGTRPPPSTLQKNEIFTCSFLG